MFSQCSTVFQLRILQTLQEKEKQKKKASLAGFDNLRSKRRGFSILFLALNLAAGGEAEIENEGKAGRFSQYVIPALNLTNAACRQMKKDQELGRRAEAHQKILGTSPPFNNEKNPGSNQCRQAIAMWMARVKTAFALAA